MPVPEWLERWLPPSVIHALTPLLTPGVLLTLSLLSLAMFVASVIGVPYFFVRLPEDYFSRREQADLGLHAAPKPVWRHLLALAKNALGAFLVVLGLILIPLPGQGVLTLFVGLLIMNFPGKHRFERWLILRPSVLRAINAIRRRAGKAPLADVRSSRPSLRPPAA